MMKAFEVHKPHMKHWAKMWGGDCLAVCLFVLCCLFDFVLRRYVAECQGEPQNAQERPRSATEPPERPGRRGAPRSAAERRGALLVPVRVVFVSCCLFDSV